VEFRRFDPQGAAAGEWQALHAFRRARAAEDSPGDPVASDADFEADLRRDWPNWDNRRLYAWRDGAIVGSLGVGFRRPGSADYERHAGYANLWGGVLTGFRRQGVMSGLMRAALPVFDEIGARTLSLGSHLESGHAFCEAIGAVLKHRSIENRLALDGVDWGMVAAWDAGAPAGLAWEIHTGRVPMARLEELMAPLTDLAQDIPLGDLDVPPIRYELRNYQTWYEELDRHGGEHLLVLLVDNGQVAGVSEAAWDSRYPDRLFQEITAVARSHRGSGLAKALKARMLLLVRARRPEVRLAITSNANVNAPMLSVNTRLGFVEHRRDQRYQISREALGRQASKQFFF
jgi:GNAT superfamily N-acetyltransferase